MPIGFFHDVFPLEHCIHPEKKFMKLTQHFLFSRRKTFFHFHEFLLRIKKFFNFNNPNDNIRILFQQNICSHFYQKQNFSSTLPQSTCWERQMYRISCRKHQVHDPQRLVIFRIDEVQNYRSELDC